MCKYCDCNMFKGESLCFGINYSSFISSSYYYYICIYIHNKIVKIKQMLWTKTETWPWTSPLVPLVTSHYNAHVLYLQTILFVGSDSYDPDLQTQIGSDLTYHWNCTSQVRDSIQSFYYHFLFHLSLYLYSFVFQLN